MRLLLVNPRYPESFWSFKWAVEGILPAKRAINPPLGLATLAQLARLPMGRGLVVLGDFNDVPSSGVVRNLLAAGLVDVFSSDRVSPRDDRGVDYILIDASLARLTSSARVWETKKSDHDALIAELRWQF